MSVLPTEGGVAPVARLALLGELQTQLRPPASHLDLTTLFDWTSCVLSSGLYPPWPNLLGQRRKEAEATKEEAG